MNLKKITALMLAGCTLFSLCACGQTSEGDNVSNGNLSTSELPTAVGTAATDSTAHYVEGTLHDVNVDFDHPVSDFVKNKQTSYQLYLIDSSASDASAFCNQQISVATGAMLAKNEKEVSVTESTHYIIFGGQSLFTSKGFTMPSYETLGIGGYTIQTYGSNVFIEAYTASGYQLAAIAFLREVIGYDMLSEDCIVYELDGTTMPKMDITERPDFDYRQSTNGLTSTAIYGMGYTVGTIMLNTGTSWIHNIVDYTTDEEKAAHPKWFSDDTVSMQQACYTAHGDKEEYALMVQTYAKSLIGFIKNNPTINNIIISPMDNTTTQKRSLRCSCDTCNASYQYYGQTISGAMLIFCNDIIDVVNEYLDSDQSVADGIDENREVNFLMLAYSVGLRAPVLLDGNNNVIFDENGEGQAREVCRFYKEDGVVTSEIELDESGAQVKLSAHKRLGIFYAASSANYVHSFYEDENATYSEVVRAWAGICDTMYFWIYQLNFSNFLYPYNSYDSLAENMRYFKSMGGTYMYNQGTWYNPNNTGFCKLRDYLGAKLMFNVNLNYADLVNKYFKYYFGEAEEYMREFFDTVQVNSRDKESIITGSISSSKITGTDVWPEGMINTFMDLIDKSYAAIESHKDINAVEYEALKKHILIESIFPRFSLCTTYASSYTDSELLAMRLAFKADFTTLKNTSDVEWYTIEDRYEEWGI